MVYIFYLIKKFLLDHVILSFSQATELLTLLYAAHEQGDTSAGVDVIEVRETERERDSQTGPVQGGVGNAVDMSIFDLYAGKRLAIKLATEAAGTILKVDQVR